MDHVFSHIIIGGGIVGLATCAELSARDASARILLLEKENEWASHQSGRNSGVIHSGIYYRPGSLRASLCIRGNQSMYRFCEKHGIAHERTGKLIVATSTEELPALGALEQRAKENGVSVTSLSRDQAREHEPEVECIAALHVPSTGIVNYREVCQILARIAGQNGATLSLGTEAIGFTKRGATYIVETNRGAFEAAKVITCAGLQSDRLVAQSGLRPSVRIVPFRGEYYDFRPERRNLVRGLIYPVPNPQLPFLGVHLTKMIDGGVHAGPNAVFSFHREGYSRFSFSARDTWSSLSWSGFRHAAWRFLRTGIDEHLRSLSKGKFVRDVQKIVPAIQEDDLEPARPGIRAQAIDESGALVDDFAFAQSDGILHVCNAPSPAATSSLEIAKLIVDRIS